MSFYIALALLNFCSFLPLYALHFRESPNPFAFLTDDASTKEKLKRFYSRPRFTDPFRVNFDFTFLTLAASAANYSRTWIVWCCACLLALGFVEVLYASIMSSVFKRQPTIISDISLVKAGLSIAQKHSYWIVPAVAALLAAITFVAYEATTLLFGLMPDSTVLPLLIAATLIPPCFYRWRQYSYTEFLYRAVYSPTLHLYRNLAFSNRLRAVFEKGPDYFDRHNHFKNVVLTNAPHVLTICVESYGSIVYRDALYRTGIQELLGDYEKRLRDLGYGFASAFSEAPIFAGGSWASYTTFTYGFRIDDLQTFDGLFAHNSAFCVYESLFHVLKRNGYKNVLLCPLGGLDARAVDWNSIGRVFQSEKNFDFETIGYAGQRFTYLGIARRYAPPDQYSLNFAYEAARHSDSRPVSLFFCTLNSHVPWDSPTEAIPDWRSLSNPDIRISSALRSKTTGERYRDSIRYQLDYILRFIVDRPEDDLIAILFGDHQPPFITPEQMGKQTPVHVICRNRALLNVLREQGFVSTLDLARGEPPGIKHEGFLSLFLKGMHLAYGNDDGTIQYRENGVRLIDGL